MKLKKRKKSSRMHGKGMGSHGWGARKKHISSGNKGGWGMSGTGKMAGHKKTLVTKLYGTSYFGKQGITSRRTARRKNKVMNIYDIENNFEMLKKKFGAKESGEEILNLSEYKILGEGEIKIKIAVKAKAASKSAVEKIEKAGGKIIIPKIAEETKKEKIKEKK